jgi:hypothetical protein
VEGGEGKSTTPRGHRLVSGKRIVREKRSYREKIVTEIKGPIPGSGGNRCLNYPTDTHLSRFRQEGKPA